MSQSCRFFNTPGGCLYGADCRYSHDSDSAPIDESLCRYFNTTTGCRYGARCRYKHETNTKHNCNPSDKTQENDPNKMNTSKTKQKSTTNYATDNKSKNITNDIDKKIKILKENLNESSNASFNPLIAKYGEFYATLRLDHEPITIYVDSIRTEMAQGNKQDGNEMYSNKQYLEAIKLYQKAILLLDCTHLNHKYNDEMAAFQSLSSWTHSPEQERNDLLAVILSNTAQCWLSYADKIKISENDKYILYILYALNNAQMALWLNNTNIKTLYRKIVCVYKLGLFNYANQLITQLRNLAANKDDQMIALMIKKLQKEKSNNNKMNKQIQKCSTLLAKLGSASELDNYLDSASDLDSDLNAFLLSISELVRTKKWTISRCFSWIKRSVEHIQNTSTYCVPPDIYEETDVDPLQSYCFSVIATTLSLQPAQIGQHFTKYIGYKAEDEWEDLANEMKYIQMEHKSMWFCEQFWSVIVETVLNTNKYAHDIKEAIEKEILLYVVLKNGDKRNKKWNTYYDEHALNKNTKLPLDGRLTPLPKYNFKEGNSCDLGHDDLINIHALATYIHLRDAFGDSLDTQTVAVLEKTRRESKVVMEIEQVLPFSLYHMCFTWLHEFAKKGCFDACAFVVSCGMNVNVVDRVKNGGKRQKFYSDPVTAIDCAVKMLKEDHFYFANGKDQKKKLEITILTLRKLGGKRYCELKNRKGDNKETKIFERIINGSGVKRNMSYYEYKDDSESESEEYGYGGIPQYMCDELLCQGIKPWDDDAMSALSVLYDFD